MTDERVQYAIDYARTLPHYLPSDAEQALTVLADEVERLRGAHFPLRPDTPSRAELDKLRDRAQHQIATSPAPQIAQIGVTTTDLLALLARLEQAEAKHDHDLDPTGAPRGVNKI